MTANGELFKTALDILTGNKDIPEDVQNDSLAAMLTHLYNGQADQKEKTEDHHTRIVRLETVFTVTGLGGLGGGILALGKVLGWW